MKHFILDRIFYFRFMKTRYIVFVGILVLVVGAGFFLASALRPVQQVLTPIPAAPAPQPPKLVNLDNDIVYVATKGKDQFYHTNDCKRLKTGGRPLARQNAEDQGYKPCSHCFK